MKIFLFQSCGNKSGTLHPDRLGSGSKGKCIHCENSVTKWFTPKEFEKFGGRETSKDWKRSVKLEGKPFYFFLNSGELKIHAFNCYCQICSGQDGGESSEGTPGPIKFFCPPNRKRRAEDELTMPSMVSRSQSANATCSGYETDPNDMSQLLSLISQSIDNANKNEEIKNNEEDEENPECSLTVTPQSQISSEVENSGIILSPSSSGPSHSQSHYHKGIKMTIDQISRKTKIIEEGISSLAGLLSGMKSEISSLKHMMNQYEKSLTATPSRPMSSDFKSAITDTLAQVLSQSELNKSRKREDTGHCANCNRPAPFKCGRCNLVRYCSEFCQQRDWPIHNKICGAKIPATSERMGQECSGPSEVKDRSSANQIFILEEDCIEEIAEAQATVTSDNSVISNGANSNGLSDDNHLESSTVDCETEVVEIKVENNDVASDDTVDNG